MYDEAHRYFCPIKSPLDPRRKNFVKWEKLQEGDKKLEDQIALVQSGGIAIDQTYDDNVDACNDHKHAKEAARILDADEMGPRGGWDLNTDPENQSLTLSQFEGVLGQYGSIKKELESNPKKTHMIFVFVSGRGIEKDGR